MGAPFLFTKDVSCNFCYLFVPGLQGFVITLQAICNDKNKKLQ